MSESGEGTISTIANVTQPTPGAEVLLVVATLGRRPEYLRQTLESIRSQDVPAEVVIVAPLDAPGIHEAAAEFGTGLLADPGSLTKAINLGVNEVLGTHRYVNWLNDDDLLEPG